MHDPVHAMRAEKPQLTLMAPVAATHGGTLRETPPASHQERTGSGSTTTRTKPSPRKCLQARFRRALAADTPDTSQTVAALFTALGTAHNDARASAHRVIRLSPWPTSPPWRGPRRERLAPVHEPPPAPLPCRAELSARAAAARTRVRWGSGPSSPLQRRPAPTSRDCGADGAL
jgi:hypothetical protein